MELGESVSLIYPSECGRLKFKLWRTYVLRWRPLLGKCGTVVPHCEMLSRPERREGTAGSQHFCQWGSEASEEFWRTRWRLGRGLGGILESGRQRRKGDVRWVHWGWVIEPSVTRVAANWRPFSPKMSTQGCCSDFFPLCDSVINFIMKVDRDYRFCGNLLILWGSTYLVYKGSFALFLTEETLRPFLEKYIFLSSHACWHTIVPLPASPVTCKNSIT